MLYLLVFLEPIFFPPLSRMWKETGWLGKKTETNKQKIKAKKEMIPKEKWKPTKVVDRLKVERGSLVASNFFKAYRRLCSFSLWRR